MGTDMDGNPSFLLHYRHASGGSFYSHEYTLWIFNFISKQYSAS
jgi:hypothetical protein